MGQNSQLFLTSSPKLGYLIGIFREKFAITFWRLWRLVLDFSTKMSNYALSLSDFQLQPFEGPYLDEGPTSELCYAPLVITLHLNGELHAVVEYQRYKNIDCWYYTVECF